MAPLHLALIDDEENEFLIVQRSVREFRSLEVELDWISDYNAAQEDMRQNRHDLYLLDYYLGTRDGLQLFRESRRAGCRAPVMFLSASESEKLDQEAMEAGAEDFLVKGRITSFALERVIRHVLERRRAREHAAQLTALADHSGDAIIGMTPKGEILTWNRAAERLFGYAANEAIGKTVSVFMPPGRDEEILQPIACLREGDDVLRFEALPLRKNGRRFVAAITLSAIRPQMGELSGVCAVVRDMSERKEAEQKLRRAHDQLEVRVRERTAELEKARARLHELLTTSPVAVYSCKPSGDYAIRFVSESILRVTGFRAEEFVRDPQLQFPRVHPEDVDRVEEAFARTFEMGRGEIEFRWRHKDGQYRWLHHEMVLVRDGSGNPNEIIGSCADITCRVEMERALTSALTRTVGTSRTTSDTIASWGREFRDPINGILEAVRVLQGTPLDENQRLVVTDVEHSSRRLLSMAGELLELAGTGDGGGEIAQEAFFLGNVVSEVMVRRAPLALQEGVEVISYLAPGVPEAVIGDPDRLGEVLLNFLSRAIKVTEQGEIVLQVAVQSRDEERVRLRFSVRDNGLGVPPEVEEAVLQPFVKKRGSSSYEYEGSPVGLAIASRMVERMGGEVRWEFAANQGSTVHFTVPLRLQPASTASRWSAELPEDLRGSPVLLVHANAAIRELTSTLFRDWGLRIQTAGDTATAFREMERAHKEGMPFRVLVIDTRLRGMEDFEFVEHVRKTPPFSLTPIVVMSAVPEPRHSERWRALGVSAFVHRHVPQRELLAAITDALRGCRRAETTVFRNSAVPPVPSKDGEDKSETGLLDKPTR